MIHPIIHLNDSFLVNFCECSQYFEKLNSLKHLDKAWKIVNFINSLPLTANMSPSVLYVTKLDLLFKTFLLHNKYESFVRKKMHTVLSDWQIEPMVFHGTPFLLQILTDRETMII